KKSGLIGSSSGSQQVDAAAQRVRIGNKLMSRRHNNQRLRTIEHLRFGRHIYSVVLHGRKQLFIRDTVFEFRRQSFVVVLTGRGSWSERLLHGEKNTAKQRIHEESSHHSAVTFQARIVAG